MDAYYFLEEEIIAKLHTNFVQRFNMDQFSAAELALEIIEIMKVSNSNLNEINSLYLQ